MSETQELKNFNYFGTSNKGNQRRSNEDRHAYFETVNGTFFIVCDGMGGIKGGKEAAEITIAEIEKFVNEDWYEDPINLLKNLFKHANNKVFDFFFSKVHKPGTTLAVVLIRNNKVYYGHVGDSRIYYQTGKRLFQLTKDHSYVMNLVDNKIITEEEATNHSRKNEITKAIGIREKVDPSICEEPLMPADNDNLLICTDGLTNELSNEDISKIILEEIKIKDKVKALLKEALNAGGNDNITIQLVRFYNTGRDIDKHFLKHTDYKIRNYKITAIFGMITVLCLILLYIILGKPFNKNDSVNVIDKTSKTSMLISYKISKDSIIKTYFKDDHNLHNELSKYNLLYSEINYKKKVSYNNALVLYYIPVKRVYYYHSGKYLKTFPEVYNNNIIDIFIVNNKSELYFKPGEKIIIPIDKKN